MHSKYVIFDRDGTLIEKVHHLVDLNLVKIKPDACLALLNLQNCGFRFGIISNQSVIGRGLATRREVDNINRVIEKELAKKHVFFDFIYICPHHPSARCLCRKPGIKLGLKAQKKFGLAFNQSYMVGDEVTDIVFGKKLGMVTVQVGENIEKCQLADHQSLTLQEVSEWIIKREYLEEV
jgi:D-glycero-D-manno-heptose 1,7-bisphosphate phosphatase